MNIRFFSSLILASSIIAAAEDQPMNDIEVKMQDIPVITSTRGQVTQVQDPRIFYGLVNDEITTLVCFSTNSCPTCKMQKRALQELAIGHPEWRILLIDAEKSVDLSFRHEVTTVPHLVLYRQGQVRGVTGGRFGQSLVAWIRALSGELENR